MSLNTPIMSVSKPTGKNERLSKLRSRPPSEDAFNRFLHKESAREGELDPARRRETYPLQTLVAGLWVNKGIARL